MLKNVWQSNIAGHTELINQIVTQGVYAPTLCLPTPQFSPVYQLNLLETALIATFFKNNGWQFIS
jgi:hypothetical protein